VPRRRRSWPVSRSANWGWVARVEEMADSQPEYILRLRPLASPVPAVVRLRKALKCLLRSYGLRCEDLVEVHHATTPPSHDDCAGRARAG
jgi:hypothetical protein